MFRMIIIRIGIILLIMCFSGSLQAQDIMDEEEEVIVIKDRWKATKEGEMEHYKDYVPDIVPEHFVLGTLQFFNAGEGDQFDLYQHYEEPLVNYLIKFAAEKFKISLQKEKNDRGYTVYSSELSNKIKNYFDTDRKLKDNIFNSDEEICSFLLGVYYRNGYKINDSIFKIRYGDTAYTLLKKMDCGRIFNIKYKYMIPGGNVYYFEPSILLKKYLDTIENERLLLYQSFLEYNDSSKEKELQYRKDEKEKMESFFHYF
ncbi:MAG: hypothetical protein LBE91_21835 [Tannerella sp.]|nr:hypothetical protein [Tannerella sp.]